MNQHRVSMKCCTMASLAPSGCYLRTVLTWRTLKNERCTYQPYARSSNASKHNNKPSLRLIAQAALLWQSGLIPPVGAESVICDFAVQHLRWDFAAGSDFQPTCFFVYFFIF